MWSTKVRTSFDTITISTKFVVCCQFRSQPAALDLRKNQAIISYGHDSFYIVLIVKVSFKTHVEVLGHDSQLAKGFFCRRLLDGEC